VNENLRPVARESRPGRASRPHLRRAALTLLSVLPCFAGAGCVERVLSIRSQPSGAEVWINGEKAGETPLEHPFTFYGTVGIVVRYPNHHSAHVTKELEAPWYLRFPLDFVTEVLIPIPIRDAHEVDIELEAIEPIDSSVALERAETRRAEARARAQELREARDARRAESEPSGEAPQATEDVSDEEPSESADAPEALERGLDEGGTPGEQDSRS